MRTRLRSVLATVATATLAATTAAVLSTATTARAAQPSDPGPAGLPSATPAATTPTVDDGGVYAISEVGNTMLIGGSFTSVGGSARQGIAAFDRATGDLLPSFTPTVNGNVNAIIPGPSAGTAYIGGTFTQVNGSPAQFVALINTSTGDLVPGFTGPKFNYGYANDLVQRGNRLYVAGVFTAAGGVQHQGLVSLDARTGALDPFVNNQFTGHHNDSGSGAQAYVGPTDIDVTADGRTMVVIGNFKFADGQNRDQVATIDLTGSTATLTSWSTTRYSPYCSKSAFDMYVRGVSFSPDGSFFVINATGGPSAGTLCDAAARFETTTTANSQPTWIDETGGDTGWGVTVTNTAVYLGGHMRWYNNPNGADNARVGAVPRAGIAALDVSTGRPYAWNPGRIPLGVSAFGFLATSTGLWVGSDQNYIGNYEYKRSKIAFFPYEGGYTPASTAVNQLPGKLLLAGNQTGRANGLTSVALDGNAPTTVTRTNEDSQGIDFDNWRGAFSVGNKVYYGYTDNFLYSRTLSGTTLGPATKIDPYNDPVWSDITPYKGSPTLRGKVPTWYSQIRNISAMTYWNGRLYYTIAGDGNLYSKWFLPDSGVLDERTVTQSASTDLRNINGMFISGGYLYYAPSSDGALRRVTFSNGNTVGASTVVSNSGSWRSRALFVVSGQRTNAAPSASFSSQCTSWKCSFDGSASFDSDGSVASYAWDFGDGTTADTASPSHTYTANGTYFVKLTVTDNAGKASTTLTRSVTVTNVAPTASFTSGCAALACSFDGGGSSDPDGTIDSYTWNFGDGTTETGGSPSHTYGSAGTYTVTLTVTDNLGATSSPVSKAVTVKAQQSSVQFVGAANGGGGNVKVKQVTVPAEAKADDTAVLFLSQNASSTWTGPTGFTGWTQVDAYTSSTLLTTVWVKRLVAADLGGTVRFDSATQTRASLQMAVYRGVDAGTPVSAFAHSDDAGGTSHTTPSAQADAGDFVVSLWGDRASSGVTWTAPSGLVTRDAPADTGSLTVQGLIADSDRPATAGQAGGVTATTNVATARTAMWTLVLNASGSVTPPPTDDGVKFVAGANAGGGNVKVKQVQLPAAAKAGNTAVLLLSQSNTSAWTGPTGVTGWTQLDSFTNGALTTTAWVKRLDAADLGGTIRFDSAAYTHASLNLAVYSGVDATNPVTSFARAGDAGGTSHVTPTTTAETGDLAVSFWALRATATVTWAAPADSVVRDNSTDSGGTTIQGLITDPDRPAASGTVGGVTAATDVATARTTMWTIVLNAG